MAFKDFFRKNAAHEADPPPPALDVLLSVSQEEMVYAQAVSRANQAMADQITAGQVHNMSMEQRDWFLAHAGKSTNPTEALGMTWYAHQDGGRMQLVDHAMLVATGMEDPMNHPGIHALLDAKRAAVPAEAIARKDQSAAALRDHGVPINDHLPTIEDSTQTRRRSVEEVAQRAFCLMAVAVKAEVFNEGDVVEFHPTLEQIISIHDIADDLSPNESAFVHNMAPDATTALQFIWRYEGLWALLWSLGFVDELEYPAAICDVARSVAIIHDLGPDGFLAAAELRPANQLLDAADFIYRLHWAIRNAQLGQSAPVEGVEAGVVMERHYALNWLIGQGNAAWDDVDTST